MSAEPPARPPGEGWRRWAREVAVIAAGALAALAAQAWWQDRQERARERDYLRQLLADTRENARRLDEAIAGDSAAGRALARVVRAFAAPGALPPSDSLRRWVTGGGFNSDFKPLTGTYAALVGTGDLQLVRTDSLRALLVAYAATAEAERRSLEAILEIATGALDVLPRKLPFTRAFFLDDADRPPAASFDFAAVRDDPEVASMLFRFQAANANRVAHLRRMRDQTRRLRQALEAERAGVAPGRPPR